MMKQLVKHLLKSVLLISSKDRHVIAEALNFKFPFSLSNGQINQILGITIKATDKNFSSGVHQSILQVLLTHLRMVLHISWGKCDMVSLALKYSFDHHNVKGILHDLPAASKEPQSLGEEITKHLSLQKSSNQSE